MANQLRSILFCCNLNSLNYRSGHISMSLQSTIGSENVSPKHATLFYLQSVQNENIQGKFCVFVSLLRSRSQIFLFQSGINFHLQRCNITSTRKRRIFLTSCQYYNLVFSKVSFKKHTQLTLPQVISTCSWLVVELEAQTFFHYYITEKMALTMLGTLVKTLFSKEISVLRKPHFSRYCKRSANSVG